MRRAFVGSFFGVVAALLVATILTVGADAAPAPGRRVPAVAFGQQIFALPAAAATESVTVGANLALPGGSAAAVPATDYYLPNANLFPSGFTMPAGHASWTLQIDFANVPAADDLNLSVQFFYGGGWHDVAGADMQGGFFTNKQGQLTSINSVAAAIPQSPYPSAFRVHIIEAPETEIVSMLLQIT